MRNFFFILKSLCGGKSANTPPSEFSYASHGITPAILKPLALVLLFVFAGLGNVWGADKTLTLNNLGSSLASSANTSASTTNITATGDDKNSYTINYYQCKKQTNGSNHAMFMVKNVSPYISNKTAMPGDIVSVKVYTLTGAANASYDCAFSTTEITSATSGVGAQSIAANSSHTYTSNISGARYFCITLSGNANGQVWKVDVTYSTAPPTKCATPALSLDAGTYTGSQSVTLSCSTTDATIRYTTDGSTPTSTSTVYSAAISVEQTTTIKAKAFKDGLTASDEASATYTIQCASPTFAKSAGTYNNDFTVELSTTFGTSIYYTTDNSAPTTGSTLYSGAITVNATQTIKAIAVKDNCENSAVANAAYTLKCAQPTFSATGTYAQSVEISGTTTDAVIRYTLDGSDPTETSDVYSTAISIPITKTLKARAFKTGYTKSDVKQTTYTIKCAQPTASLAAGTYAGPQDITLSTEYGDAIYYTTSTTSSAAVSPSPGSVGTTLYTGPIHITTTTKIKAIATKDGCTDSNILGGSSTYLYTIQYNVSWMVNGAEWSGKGGSATVNGGSHITTLPTAPTTGDFCGDRFMGWTDATDGNYVHGTSNLYTTASGFPNATGDQVFYAVFADYAE